MTWLLCGDWQEVAWLLCREVSLLWQEVYWLLREVFRELCAILLGDWREVTWRSIKISEQSLLAL